MQKELWKLAVQGMKKRKRNSLLLFCVLVIAFSFSIVGLSLVERFHVFFMILRDASLYYIF